MNFQERYRYNPQTDLIGKGGFARVYKARDTLLDGDVAIKVFNATEKGKYSVIEEIKRVKHLQHANLLRYYDVAIVENTNSLGEMEVYQIGIMELANAGDLKTFARSHPQSPQLFKLLQQVLSGLEYLHRKGFIHRDLKPQNILLVEEDGELTAKISDFGISKNLDSSTDSSMAIGTIEYMAPEQFNPGKYGINGRISTNLDLWSFGIMVHELLTSQPLFGQRSGNTTAEQIMSAILSQELPQDINALPEPYKTAVKKCLVRDAKERVQRANELIGILSEPVSAGGDDTVAIPKDKLPSFPGDETAVYIKQDIPKEKEKISEPEKTDKTKTEKPPATKKSPLFAVASLLLLIAVAAWYFLGSGKKASAATDNAAPVNDVRTLYNTGHYDNVINVVNLWLPGADSLSDTASYRRVITWYALALVHTGDTAKALPYLLQVQDRPNGELLFTLGSMYDYGRFVKEDKKQAFEFYKRGSQAGDDRCDATLGNMYFMGNGVDVDYNEAIRYYFSAANKKNSVAMYALGLAYQNGTGVAKDNEEAAKWFRKVTEKNDNTDAVNAALQQLRLLRK